MVEHTEHTVGRQLPFDAWLMRVVARVAARPSAARDSFQPCEASHDKPIHTTSTICARP